MKKHSFLCAVTAIALLFVLFSCEGEISQTFYKVKLDFANGDAVVEADVPAGHTFTIPQSVPVKDGYEFDCWLCNGTKYQPGEKITVNSDLTVTAVWKEKAALKENEVVVSFVLNGTKVAEQIVRKGEKASVPTEGFTVPEGYTLDGWYLNGGRYDFDTVVNENLTLTATWYKNTLTVTFVYGEGIENKTEKVDRNSVVIKPADPEKKGKVFGGWYSGGTVYDFDTPVTEDITLTASWTEEGKVNVIIMYGNGTADSTAEKALDSTYTLPVAPSREGYTFRSWTIDGIEYAPGAEITLTKSTVIKALWKDDSSVGTDKVIVAFVLEGSRLEETVKKGETVTAPATGFKVPDGYGIEGWYKGETKYDFSTPVTDDITLTAKLERNSFNVIFMVGEEKVSEVSVSRGKTVSEPTGVKVTDGYGIEGWYEGESTEKYNFSTPVTDDITLTAKLERNSFNVIFMVGEEKVSEVSVSRGKTVSEPTGVKVTDGYGIEGWYEGESTEKYNFSTPVTDDITLTAKLERNRFTVTFKLDGTEVGKVQVSKGKTVSGPTDVKTADGYDLDGWYLGDATGKYVFSTAVTDDITLNAKSVLRKVTVTFDSNNNAASTTKTIDWGTAVPAPVDPTPENENLKFDGWYYGGTKYVFTDLVKGDITLTAKWIEKGKVTVIVKYGNGTAEATEKYNEGSTYSLPVAPEYEGHTFKGWSIDDSTETKNPGTVVTLDKSIVIIANWEIKHFKVTFNTGDGTPISERTVDWGTVLTDVSTSREGYDLIGWNKGTENFDVSTTQIKEDTTLTAVWKIKTFTVTFNTDGGTEISKRTVDWGNVLTGIETTKEGYDFVGWKKGTDSFNLSTPIKENTALTAVWKIKTFTVTFKDDTVILGTVPVNWNTAVSAIETPKKEGHTFDKWLNGSKEYDFSDPVKSNLTLTASWTVDTYEITFDSGVEGTEIPSRTVEYGKTVSEPTETLSKEGHHLEGWLNGSEKYDFTKPVKGKMTLTANWVKDKYRVTFKLDEYGATYSYSDVEYDETVTAPENPTKEGYDFSQWVKTDGTVYDFTSKVTGNLILTARFTAKTFTVTFKNGETVFNTTSAYWGQAWITKPTDPTTSDTSSKFAFWTADGTNPYDFDNVCITGDLVLNAVFVNSDEVVVTFVYNDGVTENLVEKTHKKNDVLTLQNVVRDGMTLNYWKCSFNGSTYEAGANYTLTDSVTFTAYWTIDGITVHFNPENGEDETKVVVAKGSTVTPPTDPKRLNSTFIGWMTNYGTLFDFTSPVPTSSDDFSLRAKYDPEYYTVTFDPANGEPTWVKDVKWGFPVYNDRTDPKKEGYKFAGWYSGDSTEFDFNTMVKQDYSLTAHWVEEEESLPGKCVITYDYGDPSLENDTVTVDYGSHENLEGTWNKYGKSPVGKSFVKWVKEDGSDLETGSYEITSDMVLKAVWEEMKVTVSFITGCDTEIPDQTVEWGGKITDPSTLEREGAKFRGWYYNGKKFDFNTPLTPEGGYMTLYAQWDYEYFTVTFDPANGEDTWKNDHVIWGMTVSAPVDPVYSGKTFAGWYIDEETEYDFSSLVKKDITLTAHWVAEGTAVEGKCVVTYVFGEGLANDTVTVKTGTVISINNSVNTYSKHPEGKELDHWTDKDGNTVNGWESITVNGDMTFTAVWEPQTVYLELFSDGTRYSEQIMTWGTVIEEPKLTKDGYIFGGWTETYNGTEKYDFSKGIRTTGGSSYLTLYAIWTPFTYSVTVNANRGKDESTEMKVSHGTVLNLDTPEYDGYRFLGWFDGETIFNARTEAVQKSMTLTAKWEKTATFDVVFCYLDETTKSVTKQVAYGNTVTAPDEVKVDGLVFSGWYKGDSTFDPLVFAGDSYDFANSTVKGDIYLYARYILSAEKLKGSWAIPVSQLEILEESGKKIVKLLPGKGEDLVEVGTWSCDETAGSLEAKFTGKYAFYLIGMMPMVEATNLGKTGENLKAYTFSYSPYTYTSERTPAEDTVKGTWTRLGDTVWTSTVEFDDTEATEKFLLYSSAEKKGNPVSTTEFVTKYQLMEENGMVGALFVPSMDSMFGYDDAVAKFSTSVTYAVNADTFYAVGFMGDTATPFTRVTE